MDDEGFQVEMSVTADSTTLGGLTMNGDIAMGTNTISGLADGVNDQDAVTKSQLDEAIISGGAVKEALWVEDQLNDTDGFYAAAGLYFAAIPAVGDQVVLDDGTNSRTYTFVANQGAESAATDVSIETDADTAMARLVLRINADVGNTWWTAATSILHGDINNPLVVIMEAATAVGDSTSRIYGNTWATPADFQVIEFAVAGVPNSDYRDSNATIGNAANTDPGNGRFGRRRTQAELIDGEIHLLLDTDSQWIWDDDASAWQLLSAGTIADATSASGGGTKGKLTVDSDYGLVINSGILTAVLTSTANPGLEFNATDKGFQVSPDTAAGIEVTATGVAIDLAASNPGLQFSGGDLAVLANTSAGIEIGASGVGIDLAATNPALGFDGSGDLEVLVVTAGGIERAATGLQIKINDTPDTLDVDSSGLKVVGLPSLFKINDVAVSANVTAANLNTLTAGAASDASSLHTHSGIATAERVEIDAFNASENLADGDPVYWSSTDVLGQGDAGTNAKSRVVGVNVGAVTTGNPATVVGVGEAAGVGPGTWTANDPIYLADGGGLTDTRPAASKRIVLMGYAMNGSDLWVDIRDYGKRAA
jgi:hypothetical protein